MNVINYFQIVFVVRNAVNNVLSSQQAGQVFYLQGYETVPSLKMVQTDPISVHY